MDQSKEKQGAGGNYSAGPSSSAADLAVYLDAMRLGVYPSSSRQQQQQPPPQMAQLQQRYAAPTSPLLRTPLPQAVRPIAPPNVHPLLHQLQMARQYWPQPQPYAGDESSLIGGYVSQFGTAAYSPSSGYVPRLTAAAGSHPSMAPQPGTLSASASQYQHITGSRSSVEPPCTLNASASQYQPIAASRSSAPQSPWTASSSTSQYQPGAAASVLDYDPSLVLSLLRATQQGTSLWWQPPRIRQGWTLEEIRSTMLRGPMELPMVMFPESSAHVVRLLEEGGEEMRLSVLAGVKRYVHRIMENKEACVVFLALLRACEGRFDELWVIVEAAVVPNWKGSLLRSARQEYGETALKELITAVAQYPDLCQMLIRCLLSERLMDHSKGEQLLRHCFTTLRYEDSMYLIRYAMVNIDHLIASAFGSRCLAECFANARGNERRAFEEILLENVNNIAMGQYSNYFVQRVLERGREDIKHQVVERLMNDLVVLCHHQFGSYVVEACFLRTGSLTPLHRVLSAFLYLRDAQLAELVQCGFANYVVHKLLESGKEHFPEEALALARRIEKLPPAVLEEMHARQVMRVVKRLFPRPPLY